MRIAKRRMEDIWDFWCNSLDLTFGEDYINYAAFCGTQAGPLKKEYKSEFWFKFKKI